MEEGNCGVFVCASAECLSRGASSPTACYNSSHVAEYRYPYSGTVVQSYSCTGGELMDALVPVAHMYVDELMVV